MICGLTLFTSPSDAQPSTYGYSTPEQVGRRLSALESKGRGLVRVEEIGRSRGGRPIWMLHVGNGGSTESPALLVVAGLDGRHPAGSEMALLMAEKLVEQREREPFASLLASKSVLFVPQGNPDAMARAFQSPVATSPGNAHPQDDDRDGLVDEDGYEDLDRDGWITWLRVEDPSGSHRVSTQDSRLMVPADFAKGEKATHRMFSEGVDNDADGVFNEDPAGGVNIDRNFTFKYPIFSEASGDYAASEPETRALLDMLYAHPNIYAVLTLGPADNLVHVPAFERSKAAERAVSGLLEQDQSVMAAVGGLYGEVMGPVTKSAPSLPPAGGSFQQTAYFHAGRFSFTTPGWWVPEADADSGAAAPRSDAAPRSAGTGAKGRGSSKASSDDQSLRFLAWADRNGLQVTRPWTPVDHPDFPGVRVEAGGLMPYVEWNPPVTFLQTAAAGHLDFLAALAGKMPSLAHVQTKQESLGNGVYRISVTLFNQGDLPTQAELGKRVRWNQRLITEIDLGKDQVLLSGRRVNLHDGLDAGATMEYSWLVSGKGTLAVHTHNAMVTPQRTTFTLK